MGSYLIQVTQQSLSATIRKKIQDLNYKGQYTEEPVTTAIDRDWDFSICVESKYNLVQQPLAHKRRECSANSHISVSVTLEETAVI